MHARLNIYKAAPEVMKALSALDAAVHAAGLESSLMELVKTRASQINGCAYCIYVHTRDARAKGETEQRLYMLDAWRESTLYSDRERAALGWTEALTLISQTHAPDAVYDEVRALFDDAGLAKLTLLIATINVWNRIAIGFRSQHPVETVAAVSNAARG
jgi:AhpD family alkylhydroperoxidase